MEALEADAATGRLGSVKRAAGPGELESPSTQINVRASVESVCWMGQDEEGALVSPLALSAGAAGQRNFLGGRPEVPRLQLGKIQSAGQEDNLSDEGEEAFEDAPEASPLPPGPAAWPTRPVVPLLPLSKLNPAAAGQTRQQQQAVAQAEHIPATNYGTGPSQASYPYGPASLPPDGSEDGMAPADPLDDLDSMLGSARQPQPSARNMLAAGFSKLLAPLRSAKRQQAQGDTDWARTPPSWGASSGMQRTRAESSLQRSTDVEEHPQHHHQDAHPGYGYGPHELEGEEEDMEDPGPSASETMGLGSPSASGAAGADMSPGVTSGPALSGATGVARYLNTPRGRLLQTLAAEAVAVQVQRGQAQHAAAEAAQAEASLPSYTDVLDSVEAALQTAGPSPSKIPRAGGRAHPGPGGRHQQQQYAGGSPSRIPRPAALSIPVIQHQQQYQQQQRHRYLDENVSAPASPDKEAPSAGVTTMRPAGVLRGSIENLPRYEN